MARLATLSRLAINACAVLLLFCLPVSNAAAQFSVSPLQDMVQDDHSIDLTGLAGNVLDANGSVTFRLNFTSGGGDAGSAASGHHLFLDNVGVSGFSNGLDPRTLGDAFALVANLGNTNE